MLMRAAPMLAHKANCMAVIYHNERAELIRKVADGRQVCDETIHGKNAVGRNKLYSAISCRFKLGAKICHIIVLVAEALRFAQPHAVNDARMVQFIGNNSIFRPKERFKQAAVCVKTRRIKNCVIHSQEICNFTFKPLMNFLRAANKTDGRKAKSPFVIAGLCSLNQGRVVGEAEVVVCAHVEHAMRLRRVNACLLWSGDNAFLFESSRRADGLEFVLENLKRLFHKTVPPDYKVYFAQSKMTLPECPLFIASKPFSYSV